MQSVKGVRDFPEELIALARTYVGGRARSMFFDLSAIFPYTCYELFIFEEKTKFPRPTADVQPEQILAWGNRGCKQSFVCSDSGGCQSMVPS